MSASELKPDEGKAGTVVLYRCPTPTNFLCPCGAVARRLRKLEIEYQVARVPYRKGGGRRVEIEELTGQSRVPLLIDGNEVIHDSRRITQYLDWKYGSDEDENPG